MQVFIPFSVFGCLAILSGLLVMSMPETLEAGMPEKVEVSDAPWVSLLCFHESPAALAQARGAAAWLTVSAAC